MKHLCTTEQRCLLRLGSNKLRTLPTWRGTARHVAESRRGVIEGTAGLHIEGTAVGTTEKKNSAPRTQHVSGAPTPDLVVHTFDELRPPPPSTATNLDPVIQRVSCDPCNPSAVPACAARRTRALQPQAHLAFARSSTGTHAARGLTRRPAYSTCGCGRCDGNGWCRRWPWPPSRW